LINAENKQHKGNKLQNEYRKAGGVEVIFHGFLMDCKLLLILLPIN